MKRTPNGQQHRSLLRDSGPVNSVGYADKNGITFPLLVDKTREVIKSYGVYHWLSLEAYNIARPATFVIDKAGIIQYMYIGSHQFDLVKQAEVLECLRGIAVSS